MFFLSLVHGVFELSDVEWGVVEAFLPPRSGRGRRASTSDGSPVNGILYVATTGCRWLEMPGKYGSYVTAWRRLKRLQELGVWDKIMNALSSTRGYGSGAVDSTAIEAKRG
ncbi:MAG: transposase [Candidatus Bathyarchaeia archaeon]